MSWIGLADCTASLLVIVVGMMIAAPFLLTLASPFVGGL